MEESNSQQESSQRRTSNQSETLPQSPTASQASLNPHFALDSSGRATSQTRTQHTPPRGKESNTSPSASDGAGLLSPGSTDRVFPIRSVVSVDRTSTPAPRTINNEGYFYNPAHASEARDVRRRSTSTEGSFTRGRFKQRQINVDTTRQNQSDSDTGHNKPPSPRPRLPPQVFSDIIASRSDADPGATESRPPSAGPGSSIGRASSILSTEEAVGIVTTRFKHVMTDDGHAIITGRDGDVLQRCEDEPIHVPGAVQGFGLLIALAEEDGKFVVRVVSENSRKIIGYTPKQLFALESFMDILSEGQADNLMDHIDFIREEDSDVATNGPEVFTMSIRSPQKRSTKLWCAIHINKANSDLIICEFELEDDPYSPLVSKNDMSPDVPEDTLDSNPTAEEFVESTENVSRPLRVLRSARRQKGEAAAMEVFNIMSQVQEQLATAPNLENFLKVLVGVVKELTGFHRVMIYQFDHAWNGRVVTELVDPRATKDLFKGLNFPASDIPKQARELYKINRVRLLYDRDQETARLVCRTIQDLEVPLDLTYSYLRAMSPIHIKYLANMAVRSSMSISINAFNELWGLISCHSYGQYGMRVSFPIRKMCRLVGDSASRNIERLSYASRLQARKLINTAPTEHNPSGYIVASSEDLLKLFDADFGLLSIRDETKILGHLENSQEALALLEYLRMRRITSVTSSQDISEDFPDMVYAPGFSVIAGMLLVPLSVGGNDFIVFFRKGQLREVRWAGNPYEKFIKDGTEAYLEPRKSFKLWRETVIGKCREWTEEQIETAAVLCLVYGKFIEVWRQKEAALQNSQLTKLLLANSAHEVRTPLNAIINYLEIALEGTLDQETRENLAKSHSASKSLIYVINDLLDLTKTEEGGELIKGEVFDLMAALGEATDPFKSEAKRKNIEYEVIKHPGLPQQVIGDQRKVRQAITNITANAIQHTSQGGVRIEMYVSSLQQRHVDVEVVVQDSGVGMNAKKLDNLFRDLEQVQSEPVDIFGGDLDAASEESKRIKDKDDGEKRTLGLGLAVVARIIRNMNGQLRLKSEEGQGSRFVIQFPFELPEGAGDVATSEGKQIARHSSEASHQEEGEVTLVEKGSDRRSSGTSSSAVSRENSAESLKSRKSLKSIASQHSSGSVKSDVDRLIEAIQEPHLLDTPKRPGAERSLTSRPRIEKRHSYGGNLSAPKRHRAKSLDNTGDDSLTGTKSKAAARSDDRGSAEDEPAPGQEFIIDSATPLRPVKVQDEVGTPVVPHLMRQEPSGEVLGEVQDDPGKQIEDVKVRSVVSVTVPAASTSTTRDDVSLSADNMRVLVAEDDPVNSKIVKKRLEKLGHEIVLTSNGEECAQAYSDACDSFDVVLMDMQVCI